jgi:hypothetical protein
LGNEVGEEVEVAVEVGFEHGGMESFEGMEGRAALLDE